MNAALILSGGVGARFKSALPKQYHKILGKPVIEYVLKAAFESVADTVIVAGSSCKELVQLKSSYPFVLVPGGEKRNQTLKNGLDYLSTLSCDKLIILDSVRPLVTKDLINTYFELLESGWDAVSTVQEITDSLGCLDTHICDRSRYYLMQSPEAYSFKLLNSHFDPDSNLTEVAHQLPESSRLYLYKEFTNNPKLTYPWDKAVIKACIKAVQKNET